MIILEQKYVVNAINNVNNAKGQNKINVYRVLIIIGLNKKNVF